MATSNKILVTDNLFIYDEHIKRLKEAGFEIERLSKSQATEEELIEAINDKVGYIIGGIEQVSENVIKSANNLKAIVFSGADWAHFITGHKAATRKGIAIANAPGANSYAVAEYSITLILVMLRHIYELGPTGTTNFMTTSSLANSTIGIIGMGHIGSEVARILKGLGANRVIYWNRHRKSELENELGIEYVTLKELFKQSDVVTNHLSSGVGPAFIGKGFLNRLKDDSLVVNTGYSKAFDMNALYKELLSGRLRAAFDDRPPNRFKKLPISNWFSSHENAGYNTAHANKLASDMSTESMLNLITIGRDSHLVNPEYIRNKS